MSKKKTGEKSPLKLTANSLEAIQEDHGIANIMNASGDDQDKMATLGFLVDIYYEGTRHLGDSALSKEEIKEQVDLREMGDAFTNYMGNA